MTADRLPTSIQSPDQLQFCADEIARYAKELTQIRRREAAGGKVTETSSLSGSSLDMLATLSEKQQSDVAAMERLAHHMEVLLQAAPTTHVTIAAAPPNSLRIAITDWFRSHTSPQVLVAFHVDPGLAGGMIVRTVSRVYDFSFRTPLLTQTSKFIEVVENV